MVNPDKRIFIVGTQDFLDSRIAEATVDAGLAVARIHCGGPMGKAYRMDIAVPVYKNTWVPMNGSSLKYILKGLSNVPFFVNLDRQINKKTCSLVVLTDQRLAMPIHWVCRAKGIPYMMIIPDYIPTREDYYVDATKVIGMKDIPQLATRGNYLRLPIGVKKLGDLRRADAKRALKAKGHISSRDKVVVVLDKVSMEDGVRLISGAVAARVKGTQLKMFIMNTDWIGISDFIRTCDAGSIVKVLNDPEWNVYASASDCFVELDGKWDYFRILAMMVGSPVLEAGTRKEEKEWGLTYNRDSAESFGRGLYQLLHDFNKPAIVQGLAKGREWTSYVATWGEVLNEVLKS